MINNPTSTDKLYYAYSIFKNLVFQRGIFMLFLAERGMGAFEIGALQATLFVSNVVCEIPTGMFGDRYGRKKSMLIGLSLMIAAGLGCILSRRFIHFEICFLLEGLAMAFISGSDEALLYDQLLFEKREPQYIRILSRARSLCYYSFAFSTLLGGFMYKLSWNIVYGAFSLSTAVALFAIACFNERYECEKSARWVRAKAVVSFLKTNPGKHVFGIMLIFAFYDSLLLSYFMYSQRTFFGWGIDGTIIALFFTVSRFMAALAYEIAPRLSKKFSPHGITILTTSAAGALLLLHVFSNRYLAIAVFFSVMLLPNILDAILSDYLNKFIPSDIRASILSVKSMCEGLAAALFYLIVGAMLNSMSSYAAITALAIIPLACCWVVWRQRARWVSARQVEQGAKII